MTARLTRFLALTLVALALAQILPLGAAMAAAKPKEIVTLDYDTLPEPLPGQHHYLLVSYDEFKNTDGMLLVTLDVRAKRILCTSISRESLVMRPDGRLGRITYIVKNFTPEDLCRVISTHYGVKVTDYFITDYDMVDDLIDNIGGIEITVTPAEARYLKVGYEIPSHYTSPAMNGAGTYWFSGRAAILYMRMRKGVGGDEGRTQRVRNVFNIMVQKYRDITLSGAISLLSTVVERSHKTNMTMEDFIEAVGYAMELRGVQVESLQLPTTQSMTSITYAGMITREVDYEMCREELNKFLDNSFVVVGD